MMTCLLAALVTVGVFAGLSLWLIISEKCLVNYGTCVLTVNDGEQVFEENGGCTLLSALQANDVYIPASCGGKGACGYCKVVVASGGGPVLPTEMPYLTRTEVRSNVRLACQVKVKTHMDIRVPDFLSVVKKIVENRTYDASRRWRFIVE